MAKNKEKIKDEEIIEEEIIEEEIIDEEVKEEKENKSKTNEKPKPAILPWQFSTLGMILGLILGVFPLALAIVGNFQFKQGYEVDELLKAYNIILILAAVLLIIVILIWFLAVVFSYSTPGYFYN